jgi:hypothetical protein
MTLEASVEISEAVVRLQGMVTVLQKMNAFGDKPENKEILADQFRQIMDAAAIGWVWSTHA